MCLCGASVLVRVAKCTGWGGAGRHPRTVGLSGSWHLPVLQALAQMQEVGARDWLSRTGDHHGPFSPQSFSCPGPCQWWLSPLPSGVVEWPEAQAPLAEAGGLLW